MSVNERMRRSFSMIRRMIFNLAASIYDLRERGGAGKDSRPKSKKPGQDEQSRPNDPSEVSDSYRNSQ